MTGVTSAAATTLRLLQQMKDKPTADDPDGADDPAPPLPGVIGPEEMLQALVEEDFDLGAAIVRLRRGS